MARFETEWAFVGGFWGHAAREQCVGYAGRIATHIGPEHLENAHLSTIYAALVDRLATGQVCDYQDSELTLTLLRLVPGERGAEYVSGLWDQVASREKPPQVGRYVEQILAAHAARRQATLLSDAAAQAGAALERHDYPAVGDISEHTGIRLHSIACERPGKASVRTREEISAELLAAIDAPAAGGVVWPWPRLTRVLGLLARGDVVGITGESGSGKSTLLTALFGEWTRREVPCIVFSTEMRAKFLNRAYAALAGVPQIVAEQELFNPTDREVLKMLCEMWECDSATVKVRCRQYGDQYREIAKAWMHKPWEVVEITDLTPEQLIGHTRVLRRRYAGAHVIVMGDHMNNLRYPDGKDSLSVGPATRDIRAACQDDQEGGLSAVLLFQPRKGEAGSEALSLFRPVPASKAIGAVARVLDRHMSIYLRYVKTDPRWKTPWGTLRCAYNDQGLPVFGGGENDADSKVDDEHVYIKVDKNRTGGPSPTQILDFEKPSGRIFETAPQREEAFHAA